MAFDFPTSPTVGQQFSPVAGTTYTYNGVGWTLAQGAGAFGAPLAIRVFTASTTYTPTFGTATAIVELVGGGGGGAGIAGGTTVANTGGGGGSGSYSRKLLTAAQIGASATVNIGAAGAGGAAGNNNGGLGGDTGFNAVGGGLCLAKGGFGGVATSPANGAGVYGGGLGGQGSQGVGDVTASGAHGESGGSVLTSSGTFFGGGGGSSVFGGGGGAGTVTAAGAFNGLAATNYGSGGGAGVANASASNAAGGNGSPGVCIITEFGPLSSVATSVQIKTITASGNYVPPSGLLSAIVEVVGGGGGGGGATASASSTMQGGGGGGGGYSRRALTAAQIGASQAIVIGAAGNAGSANGGAGGDTTFGGTLVVAKGGQGGLQATSAINPQGGLGGVPGTGDFTSAGAVGGWGLEGTSGTAIYALSGNGAPGPFGGGASTPIATIGANATGYGAGGSGGSSHSSAATFAGGNGSAGVCIITEFIAISAVPAPGFPVQIARVDVSSAVAQVAFTSGLDATYDEYELHIINYLHSPANEHVAMQISTDGGATWVASAGAYQWGYRAAYTAAAGIDSTSSSDTAMNLGGIMQSVNTNNIPLNSVIKFRQPSNSTLWKSFDSYSTGHHATNGLWFSSGMGSRVATAAFNAIKVFPRTGNITAGTFILYGIKK